MKCREGGDRVCLLGDEQQEKWNEKGENREKECRQERLDHFGFPFVLVQVKFL